MHTPGGAPFRLVSPPSALTPTRRALCATDRPPIPTPPTQSGRTPGCVVGRRCKIMTVTTSQASTRLYRRRPTRDRYGPHRRLTGRLFASAASRYRPATRLLRHLPHPRRDHALSSSFVLSTGPTSTAQPGLRARIATNATVTNRVVAEANRRTSEPVSSRRFHRAADHPYGRPAVLLIHFRLRKPKNV